MGPNAPFEGITYQPLTQGIAYGTLRFIPAVELERAALGPDVIVVTDDVPNDIPLVGGLITEAFQTPLAHVNVLSQNRGTPNASLKNARTDLADSFDQLVRLEVSSAGLTVNRAEPDEAREFWNSRMPTGPLVAARLDTSLRGVQPLSGHDLDSLPAIVPRPRSWRSLDPAAPRGAGNPYASKPRIPFAIPLVHSLEHFEASGARELLTQRKLRAILSLTLELAPQGSSLSGNGFWSILSSRG